MEVLSFERLIFVAVVSLGVVTILGGTEIISLHLMGLFVMVLTFLTLFSVSKLEAN